MADKRPPCRASPRPLAVVLRRPAARLRYAAGRQDGEQAAALPGVPSSAGRRARLPDGRLRAGGVSFVSIPRKLAYPPSVGPLLVVWSIERSSRYDRASTTDVGGSPDPPLLKDNHSTLPARRFRVRSALRQTDR